MPSLQSPAILTRARMLKALIYGCLRGFRNEKHNNRQFTNNCLSSMIFLSVHIPRKYVYLCLMAEFSFVSDSL